MFFEKQINKYYIKYMLFFIIGIAFLVIVDIAQVELGKILGNIVTLFDNLNRATEEAIKQQCRNEIIQISFKTLAIGGIMFVGRIAWRYTLFHASSKIEADIRHEMFIKAEHLPVSYYHENKVGTIMSWFTSDLECLEEFIGFGTVLLVDAIFLSIYEIIVMFIESWQLAILVLIPMFLIVIWSLLMEILMSKIWYIRQKNFDSLYDFTQESFTGIRVIKAFVKENQQLHAFANVARKNQDSNVKFARLSVVFDNLINIIIELIFTMLMGIGAWLIIMASQRTPVNLFGQPLELDIGKLTQFLTYFDLLIWPMIALGQVIAMYSRAHTSSKRICAFLNVNEDVKSPKNAIVLNKDTLKGNITFNNFSFKYPESNKNYLKNISLTIKSGEKIGIIGRIGSGKTTLANSLLRLYNIDKNSILIDNHDIMDVDIQSLRDCIGYVPQDNFLFSDTVNNNIAFSNSMLDKEQIKKAARFAAIDEDIQNFANKYDTLSGERGVTLSGGQKQRISIARAFIKNAPILILDDSVSAVDVKTEGSILDNIKKERNSMTTLVIASRLSTVAHLDKIIVMNNGELEAFDTPKNLLKISPTYKKMIELQKLQEEVEGGNF